MIIYYELKQSKKQEKAFDTIRHERLLFFFSFKGIIIYNRNRGHIMKYLKILLMILLFYPCTVLANTKAVVDITSMSITQLADALDKGYLTSELLVTLYLERIDAYNQEFNAIREINENALNEAKELDEERESGKVRSILHGIPIVVKTNIDVTGLATTAGSAALSDNYPLEDAEVIKKLKEAGAIILASTNMSEFAFAASNSNSSYDSVKNVFNTSYTPYGSSGGSAVAVSASFAAASLGTDTNSSVRLPAAAAGLVGLRPSLGLISADGVIPYDTTRDTVGILSKTVEDNAIILSIINDEGKDYDPNLETLDGIKIGVINSYLKGTSSSIRVNSKTDEDIYNLAKEKITLLEKNGAQIVYIDELLNSYYYNITTSTMSGDSFCDGFNEYIKGTTGTIRSFQELAKSKRKIYSLNGYLSGCNDGWMYDANTNAKKKTILENYILDVFNEYDLDLIVYPTTKNKVFTLNSGKSASAPGSFLGSVIGYPSLTVPMGYIDEFSYGLEFFSLKGEENLLYSVTNLFEQSLNISLTNSTLTPSLYEIPDYIEKLMTHYEQEENRLTSKTKEYFLNYSTNNEEVNEREATLLLEEYEKLELEEKEKKEESKSKENNINVFVTIIFVFILIGTIIFVLIYRILMKKITNLYKKVRK